MPLNCPALIRGSCDNCHCLVRADAYGLDEDLCNYGWERRPLSEILTPNEQSRHVVHQTIVTDNSQQITARLNYLTNKVMEQSKVSRKIEQAPAKATYKGGV